MEGDIVKRRRDASRPTIGTTVTSGLAVTTVGFGAWLQARKLKRDNVDHPVDTPEVLTVLSALAAGFFGFCSLFGHKPRNQRLLNGGIMLASPFAIMWAWDTPRVFGG